MVSITVGLKYVVVWGVPLKFMTELATKFKPIAATVNALPPAIALEGKMDEIIGERADRGNGTDVEAPPPGSGLNTKTSAVPSSSISDPRILAFNCFEFTNVVLRGCPPK